MRAVINIPISITEARQAINSINSDLEQSDRVKIELKALSKGLKIIINAKDVTSMRAGFNTVLKLYNVHNEVKKCLK